MNGMRTLLNIKKFIQDYPEADPFRSKIWDDFVLSPENVRDFQDRCNFEPEPVYQYTGTDATPHERRVAWLAEQGWDDSILLDFGLPEFDNEHRSRPVDDGNHRLAAAIFLGHETIAAACAGSTAEIEKYTLEMLEEEDEEVG
jgi:hypothetical protein